MAHQLSPEIVRLAQGQALSSNTSMAQEVAKAVVETAIYELDPELDFLLESDASWSEVPSLAHSFGLSDIVVNGKHVDVRVLSDENDISLHKALIGTPYLANGSFVVSLSADKTIGTVIGYVSAIEWGNAPNNQKRADEVTLKFNNSSFDLADALSDIISTDRTAKGSAKTPPNLSELENLINHPDKVIIARQRQILSSILSEENVRDTFEGAYRKCLTEQTLRRVINDASIWNNRVEKVVIKVLPKFSALSIDDVRASVRKTGELCGGQVESPEFKRSLIKSLTKEQLVKKFHGASVAKLAGVLEQVMTGKSAIDSVRDLMTNKISVDVAALIKGKRKGLQDVAAATAEEIGMAFKQLALQPVYATHSAGDVGTDTINEALQLLEAAELAEEAWDSW